MKSSSNLEAELAKKDKLSGIIRKVSFNRNVTFGPRAWIGAKENCK
jgi:hypothetical protein